MKTVYILVYMLKRIIVGSQSSKIISDSQGWYLRNSDVPDISMKFCHSNKTTTTYTGLKT